MNPTAAPVAANAGQVNNVNKTAPLLHALLFAEAIYHFARTTRLHASLCNRMKATVADAATFVPAGGLASRAPARSYATMRKPSATKAAANDACRLATTMIIAAPAKLPAAATNAASTGAVLGTAHRISSIATRECGDKCNTRARTLRMTPATAAGAESSAATTSSATEAIA